MTTDRIAELARAVLAELAAPEQSRVVEFADAEANLLDALMTAGHLTVSQREFANVEPGCVEHGVVHVVSPVVDVDDEGDAWLEVDPTTGAVSSC
jgi:hypothetical protein